MQAQSETSDFSSQFEPRSLSQKLQTDLTISQINQIEQQFAQLAQEKADRDAVVPVLTVDRAVPDDDSLRAVKFVVPTCAQEAQTTEDEPTAKEEKECQTDTAQEEPEIRGILKHQSTIDVVSPFESAT